MVAQNMSYTEGRLARVFRMIRAIASFLSSGCGSGYSPKAPGTVGSVAAVVVWVLAQRAGAFEVVSPAVCAVGVSVVGLLAAMVAMRGMGSKDPQWIVIDEWAGLFVALCGVDPLSITQVVVALVGFRLFDIWKPGPVRWAERLPGAVGVMADDIVAGAIVYAGFIVYRLV